MRTLWLVATLAVACGKKGAESAQPVVPPPTVTGVIDTSVKNVTGTVYVGDQAHPADGYELWTLDHTAGTLRRDALGAAGTFTIPVDSYKQDNVYTMHVLKDFNLVADVDMSAAAAGVQNAFTYEGGPGYEIGPLTLAVDAHGALDPAVTSVLGSVGGGFSAAPSSTAGFASFPTPKAMKRLAVGSQLYVFEPATLLHSFYQRAQNPALYAQDLAAFSRIGVRADGATVESVKKVQVQEAGPWLTAARLAAGDADPPHGAGALWAATDYLTTTADNKAYSASAFPGAVLGRKAVTLVRVRIGETDPEAHVPRLLGPIVAVPPALRLIDLGTGALAVVDYATAGPNGLTQAFCRTGGVRLGLDPPVDEAGAALSNLDTIELAFDYYGVAANGTVLSLAIVAADLPASWQAAVSDTVGDSARGWDPASRTFKIALGTTDAAASPHVLPVPSELFMRSVAAGGVAYVRLRVYFKDSKGATEGAIVVWFDNNCT